MNLLDTLKENNRILITYMEQNNKKQETAAVLNFNYHGILVSLFCRDNNTHLLSTLIDCIMGKNIWHFV